MSQEARTIHQLRAEIKNCQRIADDEKTCGSMRRALLRQIKDLQASIDRMLGAKHER